MFCTILLSILSETSADSWSYPYNPTEWGSVSATCMEGLFQSPVDLITHPGIAQKELNLVSEMPTNVVASSSDSLTWSVDSESLPILFLEERSYALSKVQCHIGSEHTVEGSRYPGSCHFFFELGNKYVAIAILMDDKSLNKNAAFDDLLNDVQLDLDTMISGLNISYYWDYTGSITTPDCEENVRWLVLRDAIEVTTAQIGEMKTISGLDSSFRDTMPLNGRAVKDGSEIGNVTVLWYVIIGYCSEEAALQYAHSIGAVLGLSAEEMVVVHVFEMHGGYVANLWDIEWKLHVIDNTKTFVDRFLDIVFESESEDNVTAAIKKHYNETQGNVGRVFYPVRARLINSTFNVSDDLSDDGGDDVHSTSSDDGGDDVTIIVIIVLVIILLCFAVAITLYLRKRKMEKHIEVEIMIDGDNNNQTKM